MASGILTDRKQRVRIHDTFSHWAAVVSGIPTARFCIRRPILFIFCINDLVECSSGSDIFLFADDAKIFSNIKVKEDSKLLQQDVDKFKEWMDTWLLRLNVKKSKTVSFGRRTDIINEYTVSGKAVEKVDKIKDLGVTFDS